jgi:hypothetical protein
MIIMDRGNDLMLDHFASISPEYEKLIHIRMKSGARLQGAQGKIRMQVVSKKPLDLTGREVTRLSKHIQAMSRKQASLRRAKKSSKIISIMPGCELTLIKGLGVRNVTQDILMMSSADVATLTSLLTGAPAKQRQISVRPIVENTVSSQANLMQSKDMFDQRPQLTGLVSPVPYFSYLNHINTNDYSSPIASLALFGPVQSRVGYIQEGTSIIRKPVSKIINGISGDPTDHQISQTRGAVYHHRHIVTGSSYTFIEIPHLQPGVSI